MINKSLCLFAAALCVAGSVAAARPALQDVPEIENTLFAVAVAHHLRKNCDSISARVMPAMGRLRHIKQMANDLGYDDEEIRAYVESDAEKARMRKKGEAFLRQNGVDPADSAALCRFGRDEIARDSAIGSLLRAR